MSNVDGVHARALAWVMLVSQQRRVVAHGTPRRETAAEQSGGAQRREALRGEVAVRPAATMRMRGKTMGDGKNLSVEGEEEEAYIKGAC